MQTQGMKMQYGRDKTEQAHRDRVKAAVHPLTSTVFVLIKTRCRENDCREERNTGSDKHRHAHTHTYACIHTHTHTFSPKRSSQHHTTSTDWNIREGDTCINKTIEWEIKMTFRSCRLSFASAIKLYEMISYSSYVPLCPESCCSLNACMFR